VSRFLRFWWIALAVKTVLAAILPLSNDEAYYWVWGHHPQWSYYDHPSMVGWLFYLGTFFENIGNGARLPGVWLAHATLLIWWRILKPALNPDQLGDWLLFVVVSPFLGLGSLVITPDVPLLFFWSLSLLILLRLLDERRPWQYLAFGAALGLGFCSKYMTVLFVPVTILWILWSGDWRRVRWGLVPLTIVAGLGFCFPVLYWNATHDWVSFKFQLDHGLSSEKWNPVWPLEYLGGQIAILFPTVVWLTWRPPAAQLERALYLFGWLPLGFFLYTSFRAHVEANWPIMAHPSLLTLAFLTATARPPGAMRSLRITAAFWALVTALAASEAAYHWVPIDPNKLKTSEFTRFDVFLPAAREKNDLYLGSYQMAAAISYKTRKQICKLGGLNRRDFYDFLPECFPEADHFWLGRETYQPLPELWINKGYRELRIEKLSDDFQLVEVGRSAQGSDR